MLILGQRNDDSLAREFDWFGSSERLDISPASIWVPDEDETIRRRRVPSPNPVLAEADTGDQWSLDEISPLVSVRDEGSFAKPRALPEINPHVSIRDEDSLPKPRALPDINPHVSIRDEDSFAKPRALPDINPHVSIRDEDSLPKPRALPDINPHVSIRDEDSFAKPCALPEISPQLSILDESYATAGEATSSEVSEQLLDPDIVQESSGHPSPQFTSGVCGLDQSKVQPGEPAFMTVTLDGQNEKRFIQEYIELGPSQPTVVDSSPMVESNRPPDSESSGPIVLQSSRLPEVKPSRPPVLKSGPALESSRPPEAEPNRPAVPQVRVLDESQVLPGEASFATAIPSGPLAPDAHSPLEEFLAKTNLDLRTFGLATLLFVSIIGVSALVILEATKGIFSSRYFASATANHASQTAESAAPQSEVLPKIKPVAPSAVSKPSKQEIQSMAPPREYPKFPGEGTKPMSLEGSASELSRKAHANDVRAEKADKKSAGKSAPRETTAREGDKHAATPKNLRANVKESGSKKKAAESVARHSASSQKKIEVKKSNSTSTARKPGSASVKDAAVTKPRVETKVPSASNGAQRPRTVTPRKTS